MIRSMTGFGRFAAQDEGWSQVWEVKSVNGKHLDVKWRLPAAVRSLETHFDKIVRQYATRGRVNIQLNLNISRPDLLGMQLNKPLAENMLSQMGDFAKGIGQEFTPDFTRMLSMSFLWDDKNDAMDPGLAKSVEEGLRGALEDWNKSRAVEGEDMKTDIAERREHLVGWLAELVERTPEVKAERFKTVEKRITQVLERYSVDFEESRMLQEIAVLSDRIDVSEELTRLKAHLERLDDVLGKGGECGKRLDFLMQECFREINTCGNKAQDTQCSRIVVDFKTELEKCREQVQNVE